MEQLSRFTETAEAMNADPTPTVFEDLAAPD